MKKLNKIYYGGILKKIDLMRIIGSIDKIVKLKLIVLGDMLELDYILHQPLICTRYLMFYIMVLVIT